MRTKRNKLAMQWMREDVTEYLQRTNNDPHKAWDLFIKEHLEANKPLPNWIKGKKDFVKVANELQTEIERQQREKEFKQQQKTQKESILQELKQLNIEQIKALWKNHKEQCTTNEKIILSDIVNFVYLGEWNSIDDKHINLILKYNMLEQLKTTKTA
jgi:hypothetical protein